jgi:hypothetical protein
MPAHDDAYRIPFGLSWVPFELSWVPFGLSLSKPSTGAS